MTVENTGSLAVEIGAISTPHSGFEQVGGSCDTPPFTLEPGTACSVEYTFAPTTVGGANVIITFESDADPGVDTVLLTGFGVSQPEDGIFCRPLPERRVMRWPASGSGQINQLVDLAAGAALTFAMEAVLTDPAGGQPINSSVVVTVPDGLSDPVPGNNLAQLTVVLPSAIIFRDRFKLE